MTDPSYQYIYNVGMLDDLHNYFPAFLYDTGRFQTLPQAFSYMRSQMNARFNLQAYGARQAGFGPSVQATPSASASAAAHAAPSLPVHEPVLTFTPPRMDQTTRYLAEILTGMREMPVIDGSFIQIAQSFADPVPIRPSAQVLARNTTLLSGSDLDENSRCAICQDAIVATDACRKLNGCSHAYHRVCIDQWFQTNAVCPSCRHDVRDSVVRGTAATATASDAEEERYD